MVLTALFSVLLCLMVLGFCVGAQQKRAADESESHQRPDSEAGKSQLGTLQFTLRFSRNDLPAEFIRALHELGYAFSVGTERACLILLLTKPNMTNELELAAVEAQLVQFADAAGGNYAGWLPTSQQAVVSRQAA